MTPPQSLPSPVPRGAIRPLPGGRREAPPSTFPPLDSDEQDAFEALRYAAQEQRLALMRVVHDGKARAVVVMVTTQGEHVDMHPLALLMDDDLFEQVTPPPGSEPL